MLKFIYGLPAAGKTYTIINMIKELAQNGRESVLIVPEQFSFESERAVLKALGDKAAAAVTVLSFSRLCDEVGRLAGGICARPLSDADKVIFMNRALRTAEPELKLWKSYCKRVSFAKTMLDTVGEFKINAVTPDNLRNAADSTDSLSLKNKLHDLAVIYDIYDTLVGERFIDPSDRLTLLYNKLENCRYFENKAVFIDAFKGFTGQQFKIIDRIFSQTAEVTVSFTYDPAAGNGYGVFSNIGAAAAKTERIAKRHNVPSDTPLCLKDRRGAANGIIAVERLISGNPADFFDTDDGSVTVCAAASRSDEADFAARTIRRLVRTKGYRYRDFVIIARDTDMYESQVEFACKQNGVACFYDKRVPLSAFPLSAAVNAAAEEAVTPTTDNILRFHKTGLGTLDYDEISVLENYTVLWNIKGNRWTEEWTMNPRGFVTGFNAEDNERLKRINELRVRAIEPLIKFNSAFSGTAADMAAAVVDLLTDCNAGEKLAGISEQFDGDGFGSDVLKQSYDKYMKLLDSLAECFGKENIKRRDFTEALNLSVSLDSVGVIPRMLDEVTFGAADRIRPSRPKVAFVLGANQEIFPKAVTGGGILTIDERRRLIENGLDISDNSVAAAADEQYLVYCNLCCPSERLYISYSKNTLSGETMEPSAFVDEIRANMPCTFLTSPCDMLNEDNLPETAETAYTYFCRNINTPDSGKEEIRTALLDGECRGRIEFLEKYLSREPEKISPDTAKKLFGSDIKMSATRFDSFHRCRFSFFCRYGLGAKKLRPADFDVLQRGTIVHYVLERLISKYKKGICELGADGLCELVDEYIAEYLDSIEGYRGIEDERLKFLVSRISRSLKDVVLRLAEEFAQSDFSPVRCELKIGGEEVPALKIPYDGGNIILEGSIDRVDEYNGYIRVIDYKTGSKAFKLPDVLFGLNMQMLIYLYTLVRARGIDDGMAAGILYMPSTRNADDEKMAMNGLLQNNTELLTAMERNNEGRFVPKLSIKKDGTLYSSCTSFIKKEEFTDIFDYIERIMRDTANALLSGDFAVSPLDGRDKKACEYCDFKSVCGIEDNPCGKVPALKNDEVFAKMRGDEENAD